MQEFMAHLMTENADDSKNKMASIIPIPVVFLIKA
jgi:hypothetical protein